MSELNIHQRIHAIMEEVSYVQKEDKKVNNQYKFVSHDAVTSKVRPALLKHGVLAIPSYFDISADGNRTNCSMSMRLINIDKPDDFIEIPCAGFGQGIDPQDKGAGKAMSYAYKYALLKIFALETGDDPERDNIDHEKKVDAQALADKLIGAIDKTNAIYELDEFLSKPKVVTARKTLFDLDANLYKKVEDMIRFKTEALK